MRSAVAQLQHFALVEIQVPQTAAPVSRHRAAKSCDCLACLTGRPDYPCLLENDID